MNRDLLRQLVKGYDPAIQQIIIQVVKLERDYIDSPRPRVKDQIEKIIERAAQQSAPENEGRPNEA